MSQSQIALVTGATRGLGREIARRLGEYGMTVLVGARDPERGHETARALAESGADARYIALDVTDMSSVDSSAREIDERFGRLDVLVNNAGIEIDTAVPPAEITVEHMQATYATNVFGVVAVTHAMIPLLRRSLAGRIVMQSSDMASLGSWSNPESLIRKFATLTPAYISSKAALNALTVAYAIALADDNIKVNAAVPGYVATDINNHKGWRTVEQGAEIAVQLATLPADGPTGAFLSDEGPVPW